MMNESAVLIALVEISSFYIRCFCFFLGGVIFVFLFVFFFTFTVTTVKLCQTSLSCLRIVGRRFLIMAYVDEEI